MIVLSLVPNLQIGNALECESLIRIVDGESGDSQDTRVPNLEIGNEGEEGEKLGREGVKPPGITPTPPLGWRWSPAFDNAPANRAARADGVASALCGIRVPPGSRECRCDDWGSRFATGRHF